jgi:hypothetical protein
MIQCTGCLISHFLFKIFLFSRTTKDIVTIFSLFLGMGYAWGYDIVLRLRTSVFLGRSFIEVKTSYKVKNVHFFVVFKNRNSLSKPIMILQSNINK